MMRFKLFRWLSIYWRSLVVVIAPIALLPLIIWDPSKETRCGYVVILMGLFWMTEAVPIAVTALIPIFGFPLLGVVKTDEICLVYMKETNMMFLGGLTVAIAVEFCNLHKRIALAVILRVGQSPLRLMAGFMLTTMFLSMWISNTAATAMMVPIVDAILRELYKMYSIKEENDIHLSSNGESNPTYRPSETDDSLALRRVRGEQNKDTPPKEIEIAEEASIVVEATSLTATPPDESCRALRDMFFLATAYGANLGGTGSITGSGTNLVLKGVLKSSFPGGTDLNFASWMLFNVPGMLVCGIITFIWLQFLFLGCGTKRKVPTSSPQREERIRIMITKKYDELGPMSFHEKSILFWFVSLVLLWLFLAPGFITGWGSYFVQWFGPDGAIDDATPAMLIVFILFVFPAKPNFMCLRDRGSSEYPSRSPACLTWKVVQEKVPWGIILLMGGGFAMAKATKDSGLSQLIGEKMRYFDFLSPIVLVFFICITTAMATEMTSNAATASVLLPVLKDLALALCINPLYLMLPATITCSYAFMLPVATPPNAIVFGAANMETKQMMKAGVVLNILCVLVVTLMINTLGNVVFNIQEMPSWANTTTGPPLMC